MVKADSSLKTNWLTEIRGDRHRVPKGPLLRDLVAGVAAVEAVGAFQKLFVAALFRDAAAVDHDHLIGMLNRGKPVRDAERRSFLEKVAERLFD